MKREIPSLRYFNALGAPYPVYCLLFLLALVVPGTIDTCLSVIISLSPSFVAKFLIFLLRIYASMSPIKIIWYPLLFQVFVLSDNYYKKDVLLHSCLFRLDKCVRCWSYTDPGHPPAVGGTGL